MLSRLVVDGEKVKQFRKARRFTKEDLRLEASLSWPTVARIESGETPEPRLDTVNKLAYALGVPASKITREEDIEEPVIWEQ